MTEIIEDNKLVFSTHQMWKEEKVPLQYLLELHTTNETEAEQLKQQILQALELKKRIEEKDKELELFIKKNRADKYANFSNNEAVAQHKLLQQLLGDKA